MIRGVKWDSHEVMQRTVYLECRTRSRGEALENQVKPTPRGSISACWTRQLVS